MPGLRTEVSALAMTVDGYPETHYRMQTMVSKIPLEQGATISDHAVPVPLELTLVGIVERGDTAAYWNLRALQEQAEPISVFTRWAYHPEMLIIELEPRQHGPRSMNFTMKLQEIKRVGVTPTSVNRDRTSAGAEERTDEVTRGIVSSPLAVLADRQVSAVLTGEPPGSLLLRDAITGTEPPGSAILRDEAALREIREMNKPRITGFTVNYEAVMGAGRDPRYTATLQWDALPNIDAFELRWRNDLTDDWSEWRASTNYALPRSYPNPAKLQTVISRLPGRNNLLYTFQIRARVAGEIEPLTQVTTITQVFTRR